MIMQKYILFVSMVLLTSCLYSSEPIVGNDSIIFSNVEIEIFREKTKKISDNIEILFKDEIYIVKEWKRVIIYRKEYYNNEASNHFLFYDYEGQLLNKTESYYGSFDVLHLIRENKIILVQKSQVMNSNISFLFSKNGRMMNSFRHSHFVVMSGKSDDDLYFWLLSRRSRETKKDEKPSNPFFPGILTYHYLEIYNSSLELIDSEELYGSGNVHKEINGSTLDIIIPEPQMPG